MTTALAITDPPKTTALALTERPHAVQWLIRELRSPVAQNLVPAPLRYPPNATQAQVGRVDADRVIWAETCVALDLQRIGEAVKHVTVIAGAPVITAELHRKVAIKWSGVEVQLVEQDEHHATVRARRPGGQWSTATYTFRDALRAGYLDVTYKLWENGTNGQGTAREWKQVEYDLLTEELITRPKSEAPAWVANARTKMSWKENWRRQRSAMLVARASAMVLRIVDPVPTIRVGTTEFTVAVDARDEFVDDDQPTTAGEIPAAAPLTESDDMEVVDGEIVVDEADQADDQPEGQNDGAIAEMPAPAPVAGETKVVDLMAALEESLAAAKALAPEAWRKAFMSKASRAGMPDEHRHALISTATGGRCTSSKDVLRTEMVTVMQALDAAIAEIEAER